VLPLPRAHAWGRLVADELARFQAVNDAGER
jgi:hypothetical protein